eukprot:573187-Amphidinium_carterae.1
MHMDSLFAKLKQFWAQHEFSCEPKHPHTRPIFSDALGHCDTHASKTIALQGVSRCVKAPP